MATENQTERIPLLREAQAAKYLGYEPSTLRFWRARQKGPRFIKPNGRVIRYRQEDLDAWLDAQEQGGSPAAAVNP